MRQVERQVPYTYTFMQPVTVNQQRQVTEYQQVVENVPYTYTEQVPVTTMQAQTRQVCVTVPQTVTRQVPVTWTVAGGKSTGGGAGGSLAGPGGCFGGNPAGPGGNRVSVSVPGMTSWSPGKMRSGLGRLARKPAFSGWL